MGGGVSETMPRRPGSRMKPLRWPDKRGVRGSRASPSAPWAWWHRPLRKNERSGKKRLLDFAGAGDLAICTVRLNSLAVLELEQGQYRRAVDLL